MIAREGRQPQRQPGEIDSARILVDTVEAALRDQAAGVEFFVLVRRDRRPGRWPTLPGGD